MHAEGSFNGRVHRDATELANGSEREDVGQRVGIVQDSTKILDVANKRRNLGAAIGVDLQLTVAAPDVSEEIRVFENRNSRLAVEKHPGRWDELVTRGQLGKGKPKPHGLCCHHRQQWPRGERLGEASRRQQLQLEEE